jgi:hypothetical protein
MSLRSTWLALVFVVSACQFNIRGTTGSNDDTNPVTMPAPVGSVAVDLATGTGADLATAIDLGTVPPDLAQLPYAIGDACDGACGGGLTCMTWLPAGYCSLPCKVNKDCPNGSSCVEVDGGSFCLRDAAAGCPRSDARCINCSVNVCGPASFCDAC